MELYNSIIRKVEELAGSSTPRRCPYDPQGAWEDTGSFELVMLRDAAYELGGSSKELDAIINYLKGVLGAKVACFFYEKTETDVKGSFRGNDGYDVCALAQKFGGGGHVKAAGCTISAPIAKAKEMVLAEVEKML